MPRVLTIKHPERPDVILGKLKIPDGKTNEEIRAAGLKARDTLLKRWNEKQAAAQTAAAPPPAPSPGEKTFVCSVCRQQKRESELEEHVAAHEKMLMPPLK